MGCQRSITAACKPSSWRRDLVPLGQTRTKFNFNLDEKRVLNFENEVSDDDNIKQDMSIDVYGRKDEDPAPTAAAPDAKSEKKPEVRPHLGRRLDFPPQIRV